MITERDFQPKIEPLAERQEALKAKILHIQLEYAQKLFEKEVSSPSENVNVEAMNFEQVIDNFTDLSKKIGDAYNQWKGEPFYGEHYQEFDGKRKEIVSKIEAEYRINREGWIEKIDTLILDVLPRGDRAFEPEKTEESRAGILRYDVSAGHGGLEQIDINDKDICIKTHLDPLFMQEGVSQGKSLSELYEEAYGILVRQIVEKYPDASKKIKAIISESWLFDTNLVEKIGIIYTYPSSNEDSFRGTTFWGQFINKDGEINQERVDLLLEKRKPSSEKDRIFRVKSMYIPMDEFLAKYGPKK